MNVPVEWKTTDARYPRCVTYTHTNTHTNHCFLLDILKHFSTNIASNHWSRVKGEKKRDLHPSLTLACSCFCYVLHAMSVSLCVFHSSHINFKGRFLCFLCCCCCCCCCYEWKNIRHTVLVLMNCTFIILLHEAWLKVSLEEERIIIMQLSASEAKNKAHQRV